MHQAKLPLLVGPASVDFAASDLADAVAGLPYRQRAVLVLRYHVGLSEAEIAETLDVRAGTVKSLCAPRIRWSTKYVEFIADAVTIDVGGKRFVGADPALLLNSDPGDAQYQTLEVDWHEHALPMRVNIYFAADDHEWWISELRTYNGQADSHADWVTFTGERLRTARGAPFEGDLDLNATENGITSHLRITGLHLMPFRATCAGPGGCNDGGQQPSDSGVATTGASVTDTTIQGPPNVAPPPGFPTPDLGTFTDTTALVAALIASGPLDNETPVAVGEGRAPGVSVCADNVANREPDSGTLVHQAAAGYGSDGGVILVLQRADGRPKYGCTPPALPIRSTVAAVSFSPCRSVEPVDLTNFGAIVAVSAGIAPKLTIRRPPARGHVRR